MFDLNLSSISLLICILIPCVVCFFAVPLGFFLCWRTQVNATIYSLSLQVRLQIFLWTLNVTNLLVMTLYLLYFWLTPDDDETEWERMNISWFEMVLRRVRSVNLNVSRPVIFTLNGMYMTLSIACTIVVTFIMIDRCYALMYPIYYTERTKSMILRTCLTCIITWTIYSVFSMIFFDWANFATAKCYTVYCSLSISIIPLLYLKCIMTVINLILSIFFCLLWWRRNTNKMALHHTSSYLAQRANMIAMWSVFSEFTFNTLPIYTLVVSVIFQINTNLPIYGQFIATGVALDGLCTILLYIKLIVLKRHRIVANKIGDFAVKFHHGFGIGKPLDQTSSRSKPKHSIRMLSTANSS